MALPNIILYQAPFAASAMLLLPGPIDRPGVILRPNS
jgi:hypothetical protein